MAKTANPDFQQYTQSLNWAVPRANSKTEKTDGLDLFIFITHLCTLD